jgi:hypothetical protein
MIREQSASAHGTSLDSLWLYVDAPSGRGWVAKRYTEEIEEFIPSPAWPKVPNGLAEIKRVFGEPGRAICNAGRVHLAQGLPLSWEMNTKVTVVSCHKLIEDVLQSVFDTIHARGYWNLLQDWGGCYNYRPSKVQQPDDELQLEMDSAVQSQLASIAEAEGVVMAEMRAASKLSTHAWGIGLDINVKQNPLRARPKMDPRIVAIFRDHGFKWGGDWSRPDGMHFQFATGY